MSNFNEFTFQNLNGIDAVITLEAPVGTTVIGPVTVRGNSTFTGNPGVTDVSEVKLTVVTSSHEHTPDKELFTLTGSPYKGCFQKLSARSLIGSIHGTVTAAF